LTYAATIGAALRAELGDSHQAVKKLARWTGASERTVKNWLSGRRGPAGRHLIGIIRHSDRALYALLALSGRKKAIAVAKVATARECLAGALRDIDALMD
jgi:hypothetical protein